ncbi:MAG: type II toxin-antitoxin system PemK/MazF family toxin [Pirellulales bacterium]
MNSRGDIVLLDMPFAQGGGSKVRPALIVQSNRNNARISNTIVASITRNISRVHEPTQLVIDIATDAGQQSGLLATSAVTCENLFTVGRRFIQRTIGSLPKEIMLEIDSCLKESLGVK